MKEYFIKLETVKTTEIVTGRKLLPIAKGEQFISEIGTVKNGVKLLDCYEIK